MLSGIRQALRPQGYGPVTAGRTADVNIRTAHRPEDADNRWARFAPDLDVPSSPPRTSPPKRHHRRQPGDAGRRPPSRRGGTEDAGCETCPTAGSGLSPGRLRPRRATIEWSLLVSSRSCLSRRSACRPRTRAATAVMSSISARGWPVWWLRRRRRRRSDAPVHAVVPQRRAAAGAARRRCDCR